MNEWTQFSDTRTVFLSDFGVDPAPGVGVAVIVISVKLFEASASLSALSLIVVPPPVPGTGLGVKVACIPAGRPEALNAMSPFDPFRRLIAIGTSMKLP